VKLGPRVRAEPLPQEEIPSIPASVIEPFLTRPLVIEPDGLDKAPNLIVATQHDSVLLSAGNTAYVPASPAPRRKFGTTCTARRQSAGILTPTRRSLRGDLSRHARVTRPGDPATVVLVSAVQAGGSRRRQTGGCNAGAAATTRRPILLPHSSRAA